MDGRDLVRSVKAVGSRGAARGLRTVRAAWRRQRADARGLPRRGAERARVPGPCRRGAGAGRRRRPLRALRAAGRGRGERRGVLGLGRGRTRAVVRARGPAARAGPAGRAGAGQGRRLAGGVRAGDGRRVAARRGGGAHAGRGAAAAGAAAALVGAGRTGGAARWVQRSEVAGRRAVLRAGRPGVGAAAAGRHVPAVEHRSRAAFGPGDDPLYLTMPVQLVVADAGTHLVFHDTTWDGTVTLREGEEGAGSGHDRRGRRELRMDGGPLRCWVMAGTPARVLRAWAALTGAPALPPAWALGHQHAAVGLRRRAGGAADRRRATGSGACRWPRCTWTSTTSTAHRVFTVDRERFPNLPRLAEDLRAGRGAAGVDRRPGGARRSRATPCSTAGRATDAFVRDARGAARARRGRRPGESVYPGLHRPACAAVVGRAVRGAARAGLRRGSGTT